MRKQSVKTALAVNGEAVREFLENVIDRPWFHLYSGNPKGKKGAMRGRVFPDALAALNWITEQSAKGCNIYWAVNAPSNKQTKKASADELRWLSFVHLDLDMPKDIRAKDREPWLAMQLDRVADCRRIPGSPSIWVSGNGIQAVWRLAKPLRANPANIEAVERVNRRLIQEFGAPAGTHDATRVVRVPGTPNWPNAVKESLGWAPVMSTLEYVSHDEFTLADFDALPEAQSTAKGSRAGHTDHTRKPYSKGYQPWLFADLATEEPELDADIRKTLDAPGDEGNRSAALWCFLQRACDFIERKELCDAADLVGDRDIYRNLMEITMDSPEHGEALAEMYGHVEQYGLPKLGYDVTRVVEYRADQKKGASGKGLAEASKRASMARLVQTPPDDRDTEDARAAFIQHVKTCMDARELPNCVYNGDNPAHRQHATEANIRAILRAAGIVARWDVMRDQPRYHIKPEAGRSARSEGEPRRNFAAATRRAHRDILSVAETNLILDALCIHFISDRKVARDLLGIITREIRYHPLQEYCEARPWDGKPRIADVAACLDTSHPLAPLYITMFFRRCVAAVSSLEHYLKTDSGLQISGCVVLVGPQGIGKTTFWKKLVPPGFLSKGTSLKLGQSRDTDSMREVLSGMVAVLDEIGGSLTRSENEALKNFQTADYDEFRVAFAPVPVSKPRMTQLVGTSNELHLQDHTGSRRFEALPIEQIDFAALADIDLQQCYAEAWSQVRVDGARWWLTGEDALTRDAHNAAHRLVHDDEAAIESYLQRENKAHNLEWLTAREICEVLQVRYYPQRWGIMKRVLDAEGMDYRNKITTSRGVLRKVYGFPVRPEVFQLLTGK